MELETVRDVVETLTYRSNPLRPAAAAGSSAASAPPAPPAADAHAARSRIVGTATARAQPPNELSLRLVHGRARMNRTDDADPRGRHPGHRHGCWRSVPLLARARRTLRRDADSSHADLT